MNCYNSINVNTSKSEDLLSPNCRWKKKTHHLQKEKSDEGLSEYTVSSLKTTVRVQPGWKAKDILVVLGPECKRKKNEHTINTIRI